MHCPWNKAARTASPPRAQRTETDKRVRTEKQEKRRRGEKRGGRTKRVDWIKAKTRSVGKRLGKRVKVGGTAEAVAGRGRKDDTAAQKRHSPTILQEEEVTPDAPSPAHLKSDTETRKETKTRTETENGIGTETETRTETETGEETETEKEIKIEPAAVEEMIESLAQEKRKEEREDDVLVAESAGVPKGPKEAGKRGMVIETDSVTGNADVMDVLLSHRLSKILMALTCLPSREPSQSPLLQPPLQYLAPQDSLQHLLIDQYKTLTSPTAGRKSENGVLLVMMKTGEVVTANHSRCHHLDITAMSQTAIQTN